jgi:DNA-directed RNA polymerase specialized sigma24 family protein
MTAKEDAPPGAANHPGRFRTTRWSVVHAAAGSDPRASRAALATLCEAYWYPVYAFVRRSGHDAELARDLTQGFFTRLIEKRDIGAADPGRGRFRAFLLGTVRHFLANERDRERALKRGGGRPLLSVDFDGADQRYRLEAVEGATPEKLFLRGWARSLVARATELLAREYGTQGKRIVFERLMPVLTGDDLGASREELGRQLEMTEGAVNVAIHRMRRRFRHTLKEEVSRTLVDPVETEEELRALLGALAE